MTAKYTIYRFIRLVARVLPPDVAYWVFAPYAAIRCLPLALTVKEWPAPALGADPDASRPGLLTRWRWQQTFYQRWLTVLWSDSWNEPRWRTRFRATGAERLMALSKD